MVAIQNVYKIYIYHISANSVAIHTFYIQKKSKELYMPAKFCVQNICKSLSKCGILL